MALCRCPHCGSTFQVSIPPDSEYYDQHPQDEDGLVPWVCLDCRRNGVEATAGRAAPISSHRDAFWWRDSYL